MERHDHDVNRRAATNQTDFYMPAMPRFAAENGRVERFIKSLLRRRGGIRPAPNQDRKVT